MAFPVTIYRSLWAPAQTLPKCRKVIQKERCPVSHYVSKNIYISDTHEYEMEGKVQPFVSLLRL